MNLLVSWFACQLRVIFNLRFSSTCPKGGNAPILEIECDHLACLADGKNLIWINEKKRNNNSNTIAIFRFLPGVLSFVVMTCVSMRLISL